jgi:hypothetical protein
VGTLAATAYNANPFRGKDDTVIRPEDIFPSLRAVAAESTGEQTIEEQIAILTAIMGCGPGKAVGRRQ